MLINLLPFVCLCVHIHKYYPTIFHKGVVIFSLLMLYKKKEETIKQIDFFYGLLVLFYLSMLSLKEKKNRKVFLPNVKRETEGEKMWTV